VGQLDKLVQFVHDFQLEQMDTDTLDHAKLILLDSIGAVISGNQTPEVVGMYEGKKGNFSILGTKYGGDKQWAALVNGQGMVSEEMDEGNSLAKSHPASHVLPSLIACSEGQWISGREFLASFIAGYEVAARIGFAIQLKPEIHPHGNFGMVGGAASLSKLLHHDAGKIEQMMALALSLPLVSLWESALKGHRVRDVYMGVINMVNTMLPALADAGYTAPANAAEIVYNEILGTKFDMNQAVDNIGKSYFLMNSYFKVYPYCRYCHGPIDALTEILDKHEIDPGQIKEVQVFTYDIASKLNTQNKMNDFAVKFSIPLALQDMLNKKYAYHSDDFAKKVSVFEDAEINKKLPFERNTRIELMLENGKTYSHYQIGATGDQYNPLTQSDIVNKFMESVSRILGENAAHDIMRLCLTIEKPDVTIDQLITLCKAK
jgi:2-methylcitrate dehydratase PrpD